VLTLFFLRGITSFLPPKVSNKQLTLLTADDFVFSQRYHLLGQSWGGILAYEIECVLLL